MICTLHFDIYNQNGNLFDYKTTLRLKCIKWQLPLFLLVNAPNSIYLDVDFGFIFAYSSYAMLRAAMHNVWEMCITESAKFTFGIRLLTHPLLLLIFAISFLAFCLI